MSRRAYIAGHSTDPTFAEAVSDGTWNGPMSPQLLTFAAGIPGEVDQQLQLLPEKHIAETTSLFRSLLGTPAAQVLGLGGPHPSPRGGFCDATSTIVIASSFSDYHWRLAAGGSGTLDTLMVPRFVDGRFHWVHFPVGMSTLVAYAQR